MTNSAGEINAAIGVKTIYHVLLVVCYFSPLSISNTSSNISDDLVFLNKYI